MRMLMHTDIQQIRCFDLGGSGLKTAILTYNDNNKSMTLATEQHQLGKCPDDMKISTWVREQLKKIVHADLDAEIKAGYRFGFSLAGLPRLRKLRTKPVE